MTAGHPRTRHTDTPAHQAAPAARDTTVDPPEASKIALDLREWARRVDAAIDELYVQLERIPQLIEEGGDPSGTHRRPEDIRRSAQRGK